MSEDAIVAVLCFGITALTVHLFATGDERPMLVSMAIVALSVPVMGIMAVVNMLS